VEPLQGWRGTTPKAPFLIAKHAPGAFSGKNGGKNGATTARPEKKAFLCENPWALTPEGWASNPDGWASNPDGPVSTPEGFGTPREGFGTPREGFGDIPESFGDIPDGWKKGDIV
jgi:hypothetical protein